MSDTQVNPLIELLTLLDCTMITKEVNFSIFTDLKTALAADGIALKPTGDVVIDFETDIDNSYDFWNRQSDILTMLTESYSKSVTEELVSGLNDLASEHCITLDIEGDLYGGNLAFSNLDLWAERFEGDKEALQEIYNKWENVIGYIDYREIIKPLLNK